MKLSAKCIICMCSLKQIFSFGIRLTSPRPTIIFSLDQSSMALPCKTFSPRVSRVDLPTNFLNRNYLLPQPALPRGLPVLREPPQRLGVRRPGPLLIRARRPRAAAMLAAGATFSLQVVIITTRHTLIIHMKRSSTTTGDDREIRLLHTP
jgi:hypothetical protein